MALTFKNRIREQTTKTGNGTVYPCGTNVSGFSPFSTIGDGAKAIVRVARGSDAAGPEWEVFIGTYTSSNNRITRNTLLSSSSGAAIVWGAGIKDMAIVPVVERQAEAGTNITVTDNETTGGYTIASSGMSHQQVMGRIGF